MSAIWMFILPKNDILASLFSFCFQLSRVFLINWVWSFIMVQVACLIDNSFLCISNGPLLLPPYLLSLTLLNTMQHILPEETLKPYKASTYISQSLQIILPFYEDPMTNAFFSTCLMCKPDISFSSNVTQRILGFGLSFIIFLGPPIQFLLPFLTTLCPVRMQSIPFCWDSLAYTIIFPILEFPENLLLKPVTLHPNHSLYSRLSRHQRISLYNRLLQYISPLLKDGMYGNGVKAPRRPPMLDPNLFLSSPCMVMKALRSVKKLCNHLQIFPFIPSLLNLSKTHSCQMLS